MNSWYEYNLDVTTNAEEYYRLTLHARAHDMSVLPALIRAAVIIFVIVCKVVISLVQLSAYLPPAVKIYIFKIIFYIILVMNRQNRARKLIKFQ